MNYDIIGDIHGYADQLSALLHHMGYRQRQGAWRHPDRQALFVGDFIDRGPKQVETLTIVRRMVESGSAQAIMGNHEFNAIAWFLPDPETPGDFLRPHFSTKHGEKNRHQHAAFLAEVESNRALHQELVDWFLELPLWLDLPNLRLVHACWHSRFIEFLEPRLRDGNRLTHELMIEATAEPVDPHEKDSATPSIFKAVEALTKGMEIPLPDGYSFQDKDHITRHRVRTRWWDREANTFRSSAMLSEDERNRLPAHSIPDHCRIPYRDEKPLFVGHYWLSGVPVPLSNHIACVDYSVAKGGRLSAYRWEGETRLTAKNFIYI